MSKHKKNTYHLLILLSPLAVWTGLEPATPCVTGRYSNQLNYHTIFCVGEAFLSVLRCKGKLFFLIVQMFFDFF